MLTNSEKIDIVNQHLRSIEYLIYNAELELVEANAVKDIDKNSIVVITEKLESFNLKKEALEKEKQKLSE